MHILIHYGEIGTKGDNRAFFERKLRDNIKAMLPADYVSDVKRLYGRILVELKEKCSENKAKECLSHVFGIQDYSFCQRTDMELEAIKEIIDKIAKANKEKTFRITAKRADKNFPHSSLELNGILGEFLVNKYSMKVNLNNPEINFNVEIVDKSVFIYTEKIKGLGGLPVGVTGKVICLISGGIDSPVAAWKMMKRGCNVVFLHFQNKAISKKGVEDKVSKLAEILSSYQLKTKLYMIDFEKLQREIIKSASAKSRMIIYRRLMFRIAQEIAAKEKALGLVTGDNLAQVASQTLENINVIYEASALPVFAPLIGDDKNEIIKAAEQIGTYSISILPYQDCCSFLVAEHPDTRSKIEDIKKIEEKLEVYALINETLKNVRIDITKNIN